MFIKAYHGSTAAVIVVRRINLILQTERIEEPEDGSMQKFALLLGILEPLVINEENANNAIKEGVISALGKVLLLEDRFFQGMNKAENIFQCASQILKLSLRSLVSCVRQREAAKLFMDDFSLFNALVELLRRTGEVEIIANGLKTVRFILA